MRRLRIRFLRHVRPSSKIATQGGPFSTYSEAAIREEAKMKVLRGILHNGRVLLDAEDVANILRAHSLVPDEKLRDWLEGIAGTFEAGSDGSGKVSLQ